jgi:adenylosuccinate lyase
MKKGAIRRITLPEMFLTADAVSMTLDNVVSGLVVYPARIHSRLMEELPFMVCIVWISSLFLVLWEINVRFT